MVRNNPAAPGNAARQSGTYNDPMIDTELTTARQSGTYDDPMTDTGAY